MARVKKSLIVRATLALLALVAITPVHADNVIVRHTTLLRKYDVAATSYTYTILGDQNASLAPVGGAGVTGWDGPGTAVNKKIKTTGSQTTPVPTVALSVPFQGRAVNDLLLLQAPNPGTTDNSLVEYERAITVFTDANTITVDTALDISAGYTFRYKRFFTGTATTDAWFDISGYRDFSVQFDVDTINATSLDSVIECRTSKFARPFQIQTKNYTAVGSDVATVGSEGAVAPNGARYEQCRVGWRVNTDTGVQSVSVYFTGRK